MKYLLTIEVKLANEIMHHNIHFNKLESIKACIESYKRDTDLLWYQVIDKDLNVVAIND